MMSEIPQVVSNFPDMSAIVNAHDIGWSINVTEEDLIRVIKTVSAEDILEKKAKLRAIKNQYTWEEEERTKNNLFLTNCRIQFNAANRSIKRKRIHGRYSS